MSHPGQEMQISKAPWVFHLLALTALFVIALPLLNQISIGWLVVIFLLAFSLFSLILKNLKMLLFANLFLLAWIFIFALGNGITLPNIDGGKSLNLFLLAFLSAPTLLIFASIITSNRQKH